jgi:uncharacterized protein YjbI with pentapeptide repeats
MPRLNQSLAVENGNLAGSSFSDVNLRKSRFRDVCLAGATFGAYEK